MVGSVFSLVSTEDCPKKCFFFDRLDYQTGIFRQPNVQTGVCANDIVTTVEALNTVGGGHTLCGVLTGEHSNNIFSSIF